MVRTSIPASCFGLLVAVQLTHRLPDRSRSRRRSGAFAGPVQVRDELAVGCACGIEFLVALLQRPFSFCGSSTSLGSFNMTITAGTYYKLTLAVQGSNIKAFVNDVQRFDVTDTQWPSGKIGFYCTGPTNYEDVRIEDFNSPPGQPTALTATGNSSGIALAWTAAGGATSYKVKRSTTPGGPYAEIASVTTTVTW